MGKKCKHSTWWGDWSAWIGCHIKWSWQGLFTGLTFELTGRSGEWLWILGKGHWRQGWSGCVL